MRLEALVGFTLLIIVWLLIKPPAGKPIPDGAHADEENGYAILVPKDWTVEDSVVEIGGYKSVLRAVPEGRGIETSIVIADYFPSKLKSGKEEELIKHLGWIFPGVFSDLSVDAVKKIKVDGLDAYQVAGSAKRTISRVETRRRNIMGGWYVNDSETIEDSTNIKFRFLSVPGAGRSYLLGAVGDDISFSLQGNQVLEWRESFRVTYRPWSANSLFDMALSAAHGEFLEQMAFLLIFGIVGFYRWVFSPLFT